MLLGKISASNCFQVSVNLAYDLNSQEKLNSFVPTTATLEILESVMASLSANATSRAQVLVGAYGRGKSHLVLVALAYLAQTLPESCRRNIESYAQKHNPRLAHYMADSGVCSRRLLPVIVNYNGNSLNQAFLLALRSALNDWGLKDIMPQTHYQAALQAVEVWRSSYPETYRSFCRLLGEPVESFLLSLKQYDPQAYQRFTELYPQLTSGGTFNPFLGLDTCRIYTEVNALLPQYGFGGMFVAYDEFSKYLEASITHAPLQDIKLLQDFAELCDRSRAVDLHLLLICHKDLSNYIDGSLPKERVDGWRGVSGRFSTMEISRNFEQMYEIMADVIKKDPAFWSEYQKLQQLRFHNLQERWQDLKLFPTASSLELAVKGCYPLHPVAVFILPRLSEKVAQNERTMFTFLSARERFTLTDFLERSSKAETGGLSGDKSDFPLLTPDYLYDYFEPLLHQEAYGSEIYEIARKTQVLLRQLPEKHALSALASRILKTIALIYIVGEWQRLVPNSDTIVAIFSEPGSDKAQSRQSVLEALSFLIEQECLVYLKRTNGFLKLKESCGEDLPGNIARAAAALRQKRPLAQALNELNPERYLYPNSYNVALSLTRFFTFTFEIIQEAEASDLTFESCSLFAQDSEPEQSCGGIGQLEYWQRRLEASEGDGLVVGLVVETEQALPLLRRQLLEVSRQLPRVVFALPMQPAPIAADVYDYLACQLLQAEAAADSALVEEYQYYCEDLGEVVEGFCQSYTHPELKRAQYIYRGEIVACVRKAQLSAILSKVCHESFPHTPIFNNEALNRNMVSNIALASRARVVKALLYEELLPGLGFSGSGQDVSILRSILVRTGIIENLATRPTINLRPANSGNSQNMAYTLETIISFFKVDCARQPTSWAVLYERLCGQAYGIGLKKGLIPLLLAVVVRSLRQSLSVKHNRPGGAEVRLTAELLADINEAPGEYTAFTEQLDEAKDAYLKGLATLFADYAAEADKADNRYAVIALAMHRWYVALPKYAKLREFQDAESQIPQAPGVLKLLRSLKQPPTSPRDFVLSSIPRWANTTEWPLALAFVQQAKLDYDQSLKHLQEVIILGVHMLLLRQQGNIANAVLPLKIGNSLAESLGQWRDSLPLATLSHVFDPTTNRFLQVTGMSGSDAELVARLAQALASLPLEDWNPGTLAFFWSKLRSVLTLLEENAARERVGSSAMSEGSVAQATADTYCLSFVDEHGQTVAKTFTKVTPGSRARLLSHEIVSALEDMGQAISEAEKRQVLLDILQGLS